MENVETKPSFETWMQQYRGELLSRTGLEEEDAAGEQLLKSFFEEGSTPQEVVDWWIDKYDLTDFYTEYGENRTYNAFRAKAQERFGYAGKPRKKENRW